MLPSTPSGFWGAPTSSVDWCEPNYVFTPYVAELFNTTSSVAMVVVGLVGMLLHRGVLERRFLLAYALVALVGVGSIAFHGTLRFELQMLDELPMLYTVILMAYLLVERGPRPRFGAWFPAALLAHALLVTALCVFTRGPTQAWAFLLSFTTLEFYALWRIWRLARASPSPAVRRLWRGSMAAFGVALGVWLVDRQACSLVGAQLPALGVPNPQLHAWWHLLVSVGFYGLLLVVAHDRLVQLGRAARLAWSARVVPHLVVEQRPGDGAPRAA